MAERSVAVSNHVAGGARPALRPNVTLVSGGQSTVLDLRRVRARRFRTVVAVRLDELWFAARLPADFSRIAFDFVGGDGVRAPSSGQPPLTGDLLIKGYIHTKSRDLLWDDPTLEQTFAIHGVTMIVAHARQGEPNP